MKMLLSILLLGLPLLLAAQTPHQHDYTGSHGMLLFAANDSLLVSHLPLYRPPHDYQLVYEVALPADIQPAVLAALQQHKLLTLLPADFDLRRMINASAFSVNADIYLGHFERGGERWLNGIAVTFSRQLYQRRLPAVNKPADNGSYTAISQHGQMFLLHQIGTPPGYDHILKVSALPQNLQFNHNTPEQILGLIQQQGIEVQQLYLETQDFQP
ncbi:MAG: hypothetical protein KKE30_21700 [Gammaproteobacteria bacterium]|nr:hypothetical protein [Gammaproteobacteria bacterium]MBU1556502.1 hypothetical protein [Gammaproteobacteria bacterium]MBU2072193.1 hypothetical protein [Gammaproteobacteria bacterium]MBU2182055.1 hypothetical protein [Gammaproteobacteria bacterium]MBU2203898.1 hypothetical protein [Gammaproteobacteria bacterium]